MVDLAICERAGSSVRSFCGRATFAAARLAHTIRGLLRLATRMVAEGHIRPTAFVLEEATRWRTGDIGVYHRSSAFGGAELSGRGVPRCVSAQPDPEVERTEPARGCDAVHDAAGGISNVAVPLQRAGRSY